MPTSSITQPVKVTDPKSAELIIDALGKAENEERKPKRPDITKNLLLRLQYKINPRHDSRIYTAKEVTFDYRTPNTVRVDYMRFKPVNNSPSGIENGDFYCYEIKSSVEDFHSGHGLNFIGDYNYLVMPEEVYNAVKDEIPDGVGVMVPKGVVNLKSVKKAKKQNRSKPTIEMLFMMFRSAARDADRSYL